MPLDEATQTEVNALIAAGVKDAIGASVNEAINIYDKGRKKQLKGIEDEVAALKGTMKPKKMAKLLRRMEELKAGKDGAKDGAKDGKTEAQKAADKAAADAAAAAANNTGKKDKDKGDKDKDLFRSKRAEELDERIRLLEAANLAAEVKAENAVIDSALDRALTDFPWESVTSRDLARNMFRPLMKRDTDSNEILIGDRKFDEHIKSEIPAKYEMLLAPKTKSGSGINRGSGKPAAVDIDGVSASSTPEAKAEASRAVAALLGGV